MFLCFVLIYESLKFFHCFQIHVRIPILLLSHFKITLFLKFEDFFSNGVKNFPKLHEYMIVSGNYNVHTKFSFILIMLLLIIIYENKTRFS